MNKKKFCSFFVSECHLLTILLPYINEELSNSKNVEIILEEDMIENVKKYLKVNNIYNVSKIIKLGWKKTKKENVECNENTDTAVIIGHEKFLEHVNKILDNNKKVKKVINCYNIETVTNLKDIVMKHDFVLKTNGLEEIQKSSHNEQKRKTIQTQI